MQRTTIILTLVFNFFAWHSQVRSQAVAPTNENLGAITNLKIELNFAQNRRGAVLELLERATSDLKVLEQRRSESLARQDQIGISAESFSDVIRTLQSQRVQLAIDLAGLNARREAISEEREKQNSQAANRDLIKKLEQLVELQSQEFAQMEKLQETNSISQRQVNAARKTLLEAEIRLMQAKSSMGDVGTPDLGKQLLSVSLDRADKSARLQKIDDLLAQYTSARKDIDAVELVQRRQRKKEEDLASFQVEKDTLDLRIKELNQRLQRLQPEKSEKKF